MSCTKNECQNERDDIIPKFIKKAFNESSLKEHMTSS